MFIGTPLSLSALFVTIADFAGVRGVYMMGLPRHVFIGVELRLTASTDYAHDVNPFPTQQTYGYLYDDMPSTSSTCVVFIDSYSKGSTVHPQGPIEATSFPCIEMENRRYLRFASLSEMWLRSLYNLRLRRVGGDTHPISNSVTRQLQLIQQLFPESDDA